MRPFFKLATLSLILTQTAFGATAIDGWYSSVFGGYAYFPNNVFKIKDGLLLNDATYRSGFDAGGSIGFKSHPMRYEDPMSII